MKRIAALMLALVLGTSLIPAGSAEETGADAAPRGFDASPFTEDKTYFVTEVSEDGESAYIQTVAKAEDRAFSTPYESDVYYSTVFPELMVTNWPEETARIPMFRIWIRYRGIRHLNIGAVSLILDGTEYRFLDVSMPDWIATKEDGTAAQDVVLVLGSDRNNAAFFAAVFASAVEYIQAQMNDAAAPVPDVKMILHGDEETETTLPAGFWSELAMFVLGLESVGGFSYLTGTTGTPCMIHAE